MKDKTKQNEKNNHKIKGNENAALFQVCPNH